MFLYELGEHHKVLNNRYARPASKYFLSKEINFRLAMDSDYVCKFLVDGSVIWFKHRDGNIGDLLDESERDQLTVKILSAVNI